MAKKSFIIGFWTTVSVISSTILVLLLKLFARRIRCKYTSTLTAYHYLATWCVLELSAFSNNIRRTSNVPIKNRIFLAIFVMLSIFFNNASLETNSIAFYQLAKLFCIPCMLVHNTFIRKLKPEKQEVTLLSVIILGVFLFTMSEMEYSLKGCGYALFGIISTSYSQMLIGDFQKKYQLSGSELQLVIAPYQFIISIVCSTLFDATGDGSFMTNEFQLLDLVILVGTCFFAAWANISAFTLIGYASPISFQVIGHIKTILVLICASFLFPMNIDTIAQKAFAGVGALIALIGSVLYNKKRKENATLDDESQPFVDHL